MNTEMTAAEERTRIVKYLRETQKKFQQFVNDGDKPILHGHHRDACMYAANAIEAGEHLA